MTIVVDHVTFDDVATAAGIGCESMDRLDRNHLVTCAVDERDPRAEREHLSR